MLEVSDDATGLEAWIAVDTVEEELTTGAIRQAAYDSRSAAIREAKRRAQATTWACRAAELPTGGAAIVVRDGEELDVPGAYRALGRQIDRMDPPCLCLAGEGTRPDEFEALREVTDCVNPATNAPDRATAVGVLSGIQAVLWALDGDPRVEGSLFVVHGYGSVGQFVAGGLGDQGGKVLVAARDEEEREAAEAAGHSTIEAETWPRQECDVFVPCSQGGIVTADVARELEARGICGSATSPLASRKAAEVLAERNVQYAPDVLVNAGGLVEAVLTWREGDSPRVQDEVDRRISDVYERTRRVLAEAADRQLPPDDVVRERWA